MSSELILNSDQKAALKAIKLYLQHPAANVFVLKGYAGTGKTFLMQHLAKWMTEEEHSFRLLASTGRAAAVLKGKTGLSAKTVHGELYNFTKVDGINEAMAENSPLGKNGQLSMQFSTRLPDEGKVTYIVDESSMLSGDLAENDFFATFGSGVLLNDFFQVVGTNKVIFVGDPCQLPPVNQLLSPALDLDWLSKQNRVAISYTLEKIERTDSGNDILKLAGAIREMGLAEVNETYPKIPATNLNNVTLYPSDEAMFQDYLAKYKAVGIGKTLAIARSNRKVQELNSAMRQALFGDSTAPLQKGDVLLVTQNNYAVPLTNCDFVVICELGEISKVKTLKFQQVTIKSVASDVEYSILLSLDALNSNIGNLTNDQMKILMIEFGYRMRDKEVDINTQPFKKAMMEDDYLNCLKTTFGYAVTCHKAQGGEWDDVYLFLEKSMYSMPKPELFKWWYTSVTRARKQLNLVKNWWIV